jgi:radical SAM protein with 4Fe4S-binding SPASM domain
MDEFEEWAATIPWMDSPVPYGMFFDLHCRRNEDKNGLIRSVRVPPEEGLKVLTSGKYRKHLYLKEMRQFCSKFIGPPGTNLFSCGSGVGGGCVDAYGYFQPCMVLRHPETIYNLKNGSLKDALVNFFPRIREMKATNLDYLRRCGRCFLKGLCDQCPGQSWLEHGTLDTPVEYRCEIAHVQAKCLGLLGRDEKAWEILDWSERIRNFTGKELLQKERSEASRLEGGARCGEVRQKHLYKSTIAGT